jgi:arabinofuranan 3-O-arabinosyltransferase
MIRQRSWRPESTTLFAFALAASAFVQAPGRIIPETKLDLSVAPGTFLVRATHLWTPDVAFGGVQDQATGYLFPMGPFYWLGHRLHLAPWIVQRSWIALVLVVAFLGAHRVARAANIGTPSSRVVGAMVYALSPALLEVVAFQSGGQLAYALLPWALLPLINFSRLGGSERRAAARSGLAVAAMGGINAASTFAVLPLLSLWIVWCTAGRARLRLAAWWVLSIVCATSWWLVPLFFQHRYGYDFTSYTENAATTTATSSAFESIRGTANWLGYLTVLGHRWLPAAWSMLATPISIVGGSGVVALGLAGVSRIDPRCRRPLMASFALGLVALSAGYAGSLGGPFAPQVRDALDGPLVAFRNVAKFEPLVRLPLALGVVAALPALVAWSSERVRGAPDLVRRRVGSAANVLVLAAVLASASPIASGALAADGTFRDIPKYWRDAATWIDQHAKGGRTLVVPAAPFGEYRWGRPLDDPLQSLLSTPFVERDLVPLGSAGSTRLLDAIERVIDTGAYADDLADVLARSGISQVLVRNDLDPARVDGPSPAAVHRVLHAARGLSFAAGFGPSVGNGPDASHLVGPFGPAGGVERVAVEVFSVDGFAGPTATYPEKGSLVVSGGPESLLAIADQDLLAGRATILSGDLTGTPPPNATWVTTDSLRRRDVDFGQVRANQSYTLTNVELAPDTGAAPRDRLPVNGTTHLATAVQPDAVVTASSYATGSERLPEFQPSNAFDGDESTAWVPAMRPSAVGEWVQLTSSFAFVPGSVRITLPDRGILDGQVTAVRVTTDAGSVDAHLVGNTQTVDLPAGGTRTIRVTITEQKGAGSGVRGPGIADITTSALTTTRSIATPSDRPVALAGSDTVVLLARSTNDPFDRARADEDAALHRVVTLPDSLDATVQGSAAPVPGPALDRLIESVENASPSIPRTSSVWRDLPAFSAASATDGDPATAWVSEPDDMNPTLDLTWSSPRTLHSITVTPAGPPTFAPQALTISTMAGTRAIRLDGGGTADFDPIAAPDGRVSVAFSTSASSPRTPRALGLSEISFADAGPPITASALPATLVHLPCGEGPRVAIDGTAYETSVEGTLEDLIQLWPLQLSVCNQAIRLPAGLHHIDSASDAPLRVTSLALSGFMQPVERPRQTNLISEDAAHQQLEIAAGEASIVAMSENANSGWRAVFQGRALQAVRVDGWRQGWLVPASGAGSITITFEPEHAFRWSLLAGAFLAILLLGLALLRSSRSVSRVAAPQPRAYRGMRYRRWFVIGSIAAVAFVISGPVALVVLPVALIPSSERVVPAMAAFAFLSAGVAVALAPGRLPPAGAGAFGPVAQILTVVAVVGALISIVPATRSHDG